MTAAVPKSRVAEHEGVISGDSVIAKPASVEDIIKAIEANLADRQEAVHLPQPS